MPRINSRDASRICIFAVYLGAFRGDSSHSGLVMGIARIPRTKVVTSLHALAFSFANLPFPSSLSRILLLYRSLRPFTFTQSRNCAPKRARLDRTCALYSTKHSGYFWILGPPDLDRFLRFPEFLKILKKIFLEKKLEIP